MLLEWMEYANWSIIFHHLYLDINYRSDKKHAEWAESPDDVLVDRGHGATEPPEDVGHTGAGQDAGQEY